MYTYIYAACENDAQAWKLYLLEDACPFLSYVCMYACMYASL
jgi:hypothetical protein